MKGKHEYTRFPLLAINMLGVKQTWHAQKFSTKPLLHPPSYLV